MGRPMDRTTQVSSTSNVIAGVLPDPKQAAEHFRARVAFETDAWDVHEDLKAGSKDIVVVDARKPKSFEEGHIPGALNIPYREIGAATLNAILKDKLVVTYCASRNSGTA
jgi:3-mercaptopyruvate sulfurtransferase SseA